MKLIAERFDLETGELVARIAGRLRSAARPRDRSEPTTDHKPVGRSRGPDLLQLLDDAHELAAERRRHRAARRRARFPSTAPPAGSSPSRASPASSSAPTRATARLAQPVLGRAPTPRRSTRAASARSSTTCSSASTSQRKPADIADWCEQLAPQHVVHNAEQAAAAGHAR